MPRLPLDSETPSIPGGYLEPRVGDMLGPYRLDSIAGEGGMGRVFRATHTKLNKRVAVKVLRRRYGGHPEAIARFFQEARAVNVIRHPNIVEITDFVEAPPGGDSYYIMEWLEGRTLAQRLAQEKALPAGLVVAVGRQLASALAAVHKAGFVHRDLTPANVFLVEHDGELRAKILDFGVVALQGATDGAVAGTPAYLSPEGAAGRAIDGRSDIYSLGVMLYELLAGAPPFQAQSLSEYVMKHMTARPRPIAEASRSPVPQALAAAIGRCLQKEPEARFPSMDAVEEAFAALEGELAGGGRAKWAWAAAGACVALLLALGVIAAVRRPARPTAATAPAPTAIAPVVAAPAPVEVQRVDVAIGSEPPGAEVYEDQVLLGVTPCVVHLPPGPHSLELALAGYRRTALPVEARPRATASARLERIERSPVAAPHAPKPSPNRKRNGTINPFE